MLIGRSDEPVIAAHAIALRAASFASMVSFGIAQAATERVGSAGDADDAAAVGRAGSTAPWLKLGMGPPSSLVPICAPRSILGLVLDPAAPGSRGQEGPAVRAMLAIMSTMPRSVRRQGAAFTAV